MTGAVGKTGHHCLTITVDKYAHPLPFVTTGGACSGNGVHLLPYDVVSCMMWRPLVLQSPVAVIRAPANGPTGIREQLNVWRWCPAG